MKKEYCHALFILILPELVMGFFTFPRTYDRKMLMDKYPDLGKNFVMFPNGNHGLLLGHLDVPKGLSGLAEDKSKIQDDVTFTLYTRGSPNGQKLTNYTNLPKNFDTFKKTAFVTHGWMSSGTADTCISIKNAFLSVTDINVFIMDWSSIAGNVFYPVPQQRTKEVGEYTSNFLNFLIIDIGMNPDDFHLIGHSLGAHVFGFAGRRVRKGKIGRITGLDPASPGFQFKESDRLNRGDSVFVDVIHTCAKFLGLRKPIGHADFYPNGGGPPQPGCLIPELLEACSHSRSWELFAESITLDQPFMGQRCDSIRQLDEKKCDGIEEPMGESTPRNANGIYYLETTGDPPYLKNS